MPTVTLMTSGNSMLTPYNPQNIVFTHAGNTLSSGCLGGLVIEDKKDPGDEEVTADHDLASFDTMLVGYRCTHYECPVRALRTKAETCYTCGQPMTRQTVVSDWRVTK